MDLVDLKTGEMDTLNRHVHRIEVQPWLLFTCRVSFKELRYRLTANDPFQSLTSGRVSSEGACQLFFEMAIADGR